ncbi:chloride channel protein [Devosia sp. PTR5]|uniref:Chloride channel protein n=1 Tax=Devosia oryzisoli TaxID=2774138 RepID=A0A927ISJ3_9HYPH|nr:chloride channel protein [Devosia oryzisoli]MBD8064818.1 chloride channel protein [Devosia oryzisoli]
MTIFPSRTGDDKADGQPKPHLLGDFTADWRLVLLLLMAILIGSAAAFGSIVLVDLIALVTNLVWLQQISLAPVSMRTIQPSLWMVAAPALGGLVIGFMARFGSEKIRGHGIPEAIEAILIGGSRMSPKVAVLKPLSSAISIGTGGPFGAEGPIIMTGGAMGSLFAQLFHLSAAERKTLLVAGAAAGMTAIFGTPLAAVLLAVELLLFEWKPRSFIPVAGACAASAAWRPLLFGESPLFPADLAFGLPWWGLICCAVVGVAVGLQSGVLTALLYRVEDWFERLPIHWMWWPALGGLVVGLGGLVEPRALGVGYEVISDLLGGDLTVAAVVTILAVKSIIWIVALSSGTSGGVLAPLLILGGAFGWVLGLALPGEPGTWALIGMAAMMGGTMRAPLTGTLFAVELTGDYQLLLPVFVGTVTAYAVTVLLLRRSILTEKIARRGQHITREYGTDPFELTRAADIMVKDVTTLPSTMTGRSALAFFEESPQTFRAYPIVGPRGELVGMVQRADAFRWRSDGTDLDQSLFDLASDASLPKVTPAATVGRVADLMLQRDAARIPVVDEKTGKLVGLVARKDLLRLRGAAVAAESERQAFLRSSRERPSASAAT